MTEKQKLQKRLEAALRDFVWVRDYSTCQRCSLVLRRRYGEGQVSHVMPRGRDARLKYMECNVKLLCVECHGWWHKNQQEALEWFMSTFTERWDQIRKVITDRSNVGSVPMEWFEQQLIHVRNQLKAINT